MIAEILSVGTELLMGQIANTDAQYISRRLGELGINIYRQVTVGDNPARVKEAIRQALTRCDIVITTGGLGPTEDDLTKEMVGEVMNRKMVLHEESLRRIESYMGQIGREMTPNNRKQAFFPEGARIMPNRCGTAPGCIVTEGEKTVAVLPGPPHELRDMFDCELAPYLAERSGATLRSRYLHEFGIGESSLETQLLDLFHTDNPSLALYCGAGEVMMRITASSAIHEKKDAEKECDDLIAPLEKEIRARLGNTIYGTGVDYDLPHAVFDLLKARNETVCFAESLTGGRIAASVVDCPGASDVLKESYVTYSDEAKARLLNVSQTTLQNHSAVSAECASEMAQGARIRSGATWGVSATGYAGPDGEDVGTVFIGISGADKTEVKAFHFKGNRDRIRTLAKSNALNELRLRLI